MTIRCLKLPSAKDSPRTYSHDRLATVQVFQKLLSYQSFGEHFTRVKEVNGDEVSPNFCLEILQNVPFLAPQDLQKLDGIWRISFPSI